MYRIRSWIKRRFLRCEECKKLSRVQGKLGLWNRAFSLAINVFKGSWIPPFSLSFLPSPCNLDVLTIHIWLIFISLVLSCLCKTPKSGLPVLPCPSTRVWVWLASVSCLLVLSQSCPSPLLASCGVVHPTVPRFTSVRLRVLFARLDHR